MSFLLSNFATPVTTALIAALSVTALSVSYARQQKQIVDAVPVSTSDLDQKKCIVAYTLTRNLQQVKKTLELQVKETPNVDLQNAIVFVTDHFSIKKTLKTLKSLYSKFVIIAYKASDKYDELFNALKEIPTSQVSDVLLFDPVNTYSLQLRTLSLNTLRISLPEQYSSQISSVFNSNTSTALTQRIGSIINTSINKSRSKNKKIPRSFLYGIDLKNPIETYFQVFLKQEFEKQEQENIKKFEEFKSSLTDQTIASTVRNYLESDLKNSNEYLSFYGNLTREDLLSDNVRCFYNSDLGECIVSLPPTTSFFRSTADGSSLSLRRVRYLDQDEDQSTIKVKYFETIPETKFDILHDTFFADNETVVEFNQDGLIGNGNLNLDFWQEIKENDFNSNKINIGNTTDFYLYEIITPVPEKVTFYSPILDLFAVKTDDYYNVILKDNRVPLRLLDIENGNENVIGISKMKLFDSEYKHWTIASNLESLKKKITIQNSEKSIISEQNNSGIQKVTDKIRGALPSDYSQGYNGFFTITQAVDTNSLRFAPSVSDFFGTSDTKTILEAYKTYGNARFLIMYDYVMDLYLVKIDPTHFIKLTAQNAIFDSSEEFWKGSWFILRQKYSSLTYFNSNNLSITIQPQFVSNIRTYYTLPIQEKTLLNSSGSNLWNFVIQNPKIYKEDLYFFQSKYKDSIVFAREHLNFYKYTMPPSNYGSPYISKFGARFEGSQGSISYERYQIARHLVSVFSGSNNFGGPFKYSGFKNFYENKIAPYEVLSNNSFINHGLNGNNKENVRMKIAEFMYDTEKQIIVCREKNNIPITAKGIQDHCKSLFEGKVSGDKIKYFDWKMDQVLDLYTRFKKDIDFFNDEKITNPNTIVKIESLNK